MKKKLLVCVMAAAALFAVTGCKNGNNGGETTTTQPAEKKLACSTTVGGDTTRITLTYEGDSIKKAVYSSTEKKADEKTAKKEYEENAAEIKEVNKAKGVSASASYSGTLVTGTLSFTIADMDDDAKSLYNDIFGEFKDLKYDEVKSKLEGVSFTCKES